MPSIPYSRLIPIIILVSTPAYAELSVGTGSATGSESIAISDGQAAIATAIDAIAIGRNAQASGIGGIAIGSANSGSRALASGNDSVAIGTNANATSTNTTAVGTGAQATAANSAAIGNGSVANQANTVSVGASGTERRITNVADGTTNTDAVTLGQMNSALAGLGGGGVDAQQFASLESDVATLRREALSGIALSMAMSSSFSIEPGKTGINLGAGTYGGESALAVSIGHVSENGTAYSAGVGRVRGNTGARASVGFSW